MAEPESILPDGSIDLSITATGFPEPIYQEPAVTPPEPPEGSGGDSVYADSPCPSIEQAMDECADCLMECYDDIGGQVDTMVAEHCADCDEACRCVEGNMEILMLEVAETVDKTDSAIMRQMDTMLNALNEDLGELPQPAAAERGSTAELPPAGEPAPLCPPGQHYDYDLPGCVPDVAAAPCPTVDPLTNSPPGYPPPSCVSHRMGSTIQDSNGELITLPVVATEPDPDAVWLPVPCSGEWWGFAQGYTGPRSEYRSPCGIRWGLYGRLTVPPPTGGEGEPTGCPEPTTCEPVSLVRCIEPDAGPDTVDRENYSAFWEILRYPFTGKWPQVQGQS